MAHSHLGVPASQAAVDVIMAGLLAAAAENVNNTGETTENMIEDAEGEWVRYLCSGEGGREGAKDLIDRGEERNEGRGKTN